MNQSRFITFLFALLIFFLFAKIYQQNQIVRLVYQKQRIERSISKFEKKKNAFLVALARAKDLQVVERRAQEELAMNFLDPSQVAHQDFETRGLNG